MSLYVGLDCCNGRCATFDSESTEFNEFNLPQNVNDHIDVHTLLSDMANIILLTQVKRILVFHDGWDIPKIIGFVNESKAKGIEQVHVVGSYYINFQLLVNERSTSFSEGEYFLHAWNKITCLFQHVDEKLIFRQTLPSVGNAEYLDTIRNVLDEKKIKQWLCVNYDNEDKQVIEREFSGVRIIEHNSAGQNQQLANTALWIAKRIDKLEGGYLAQTFYFSGPKILFNDNCIFDKTEVGVSLPFEWTSDWGVKANNAKICISGFEEEIALPPKKKLRVLLNLNENGVPELRFEVSPVVGISLQFDSLYVTKHCDVNGDMTVLGPFATNVRIDKNFSEEIDCSNDEIVVKDGIEMLDGALKPKEGWMQYKSMNLAVIGPRQLISALEVVENLLRNVLKQIEAENCDKFVLAVPADFTENQRAGLEEAAKQVCDEVILLPEAEAMMFAIATKRNLMDMDLLLMVDLQMAGCTCTMIKVASTPIVTYISEKTDDALFSENVRQNQRAWFKRTQEDAYPPTDTPELDTEVERLQNSAYIVDSVNEAALNRLRQLVDSVVKDHNVFDVKAILLLGDCRTIPLLNNLLYWKFSNAFIITPTATDNRGLSALGTTYYGINLRDFSRDT